MAVNTSKKEKRVYGGVNFRDHRRCGVDAGWFEAYKIKNVLLNPDGGFETRPGTSTIATISSGGVPIPIHGIDVFKDSADVQRLLVSAGDTIYEDYGILGTPLASLTGLTYGQRSKNCTFIDFFWWANGIDANKKYDGTAWTNIAIPAPAAAPTVVAAGAGALDGEYDYIYVYVYINAGLGYEAESRMSDFTRITLATQQSSVSVVADPTSEATYIRVYRRSSVGLDFKLLLLGTADGNLPNTSTTYTDNETDASLTTAGSYLNEGQPLDVNEAAVILEGIVEWKGRLWGWSGNVLYHTVLGRPGDWLNHSSIVGSTPLDFGHKIVSVFPAKNYLIVYDGNHMYPITGDEEPFAIATQEENIGLLAADSIVDTGGRVAFLARDGVRLWDKYNTPVKISEKINFDKHGLNRGILDNNFTTLRYSVGIYNEKLNLYMLSCPTGSSLFNRQTFVLHLRMAGTDAVSPWSVWDFGFQAAAIADDNKLIVGGIDGVYKYLNSGTQDNGVDITTEYEFRHSDFGDRLLNKRLVEGYASAVGAGATITIATRVDIPNYGIVQESITLTVSSDTWATTGDYWTATGDYWVEAGYADRTWNYGQMMTGAYIGFNISSDKYIIFDGIQVGHLNLRRARI